MLKISDVDFVGGLREISRNFTVALDEKNGDYYGTDGLVYCGKCHTPKQCRVEIMGIECYPPCTCKCEEEEKKNFRNILARNEIESNRKTAFDDIEMRNAFFENDNGRNPYISNIARNYAKNFSEMYEKGKGFLFFGGTGVGKSWISACILNDLINRGYKCMMTDFPTVITIAGGLFEGKQAYINSFCDYDLIVFDDLFTERKTDYASEIVYNVINRRYRAELPTIFTTNLTAEELKQTNDDHRKKLLSRLYAMCEFIEVKGPDLRKEKMMKDHTYMKNLLGI